MNRDLTVGKPETVLWRFCLPLFGSVIFQQIYNIADSLIAGKFVGESALAAVGNSYEITLIFIAFAFGCNIGCSVLVSQLFGAKNYSGLKSAVNTAMISVSVLCVVLMVFGITSSGALLELIKTPDEIINDSKMYLDIYIWGLPFLFFYNISTGIFSALGDSRTPFIFLAVSSTANIFVDILFVKCFNMGVPGVAWATFICQGLSCILALIFVFARLKNIKSEKKPKIYSWKLFKTLCTIAIPSILQQSFISVGNIFIQSIINSFNSAQIIAGYSAAVKLNNLVTTSFTTLGNGISNYTAQNIGAGNYGRIKSGHKAGTKLVWIICVPIVLLYMLFGSTLIGFFMKEPSPVAIDTGLQFLRIVSPFYFIMSMKIVCDGILRGVGAMTKFMITTFTDLIIRAVLAYVFSQKFGVIGVWCAWPFGWVLSCVISLTFCLKGSRRKQNEAQTS